MRRAQRGFSLPEIMVALTISLVLILGVGAIFMGSKQSYRTNAALADIQENGRFAMEFLRRDLRAAGYSPCGNTATATNVLKNAGTTPSLDFFDTPLMGYESVNSASDLPSYAGVRDPVDGTDAVMALFGDQSSGFVVTDHNPSSSSSSSSPSAEFTIAKAAEIDEAVGDRTKHDFEDEDVLMVCDLSHSAIFQVSNANQENLTIVYNTGGSVTPGNCTKGLGSPLQCTTNGTQYTFGDGSRIVRMNSYLYYVAENADGVSALYRAGLGGTNEELVPGVQDMQIEYGLDTDDNGNVDSYEDASGVGDWGEVIGLRISLLVYSLEENVLNEAQTLSFNGSNVSPPNQRLGHAFTTTIALRNRLP